MVFFSKLAKINFFNPKAVNEVMKTGGCLRTSLVGVCIDLKRPEGHLTMWIKT